MSGRRAKAIRRALQARVMVRGQWLVRPATVAAVRKMKRVYTRARRGQGHATNAREVLTHRMPRPVRREVASGANRAAGGRLGGFLASLTVSRIARIFSTSLIAFALAGGARLEARQLEVKPFPVTVTVCVQAGAFVPGPNGPTPVVVLQGELEYVAAAVLEADGCATFADLLVEGDGNDARIYVFAGFGTPVVDLTVTRDTVVLIVPVSAPAPLRRGVRR
jgi:hypothetical protein